MLLSILAALALEAGTDDTKVRWFTDYKEAVAEAEKLHRPLLIFSSRDTCPNSQVMDSRVIPSTSIPPILARSYVCLRTDADHPSADVQKLRDRVKGDILPFCIYLTSAGKYIGATSGYRGEADFQSDLESILQHPLVKETPKDAPKEAPPKPYEPTPIPDAELDGRFIQARLQIVQEQLKKGKVSKAVETLEDLVVSFPKSPMLPEVKKFLAELRKR